ncbi:MFS transporter [Chloroflexota bacterium]
MPKDNAVNKWVVLLIASASSFITPFMSSSINIALPTIGREFHMDAVQQTWVASAYLLATAAFLIPVGRLGDIYGRKRVFTAGISIFVITSALMLFAPSPIFLIALRFLQGMGAAMIFGISMAILTSVFPPNERGKALGINVTSVYAGLAMGPFLGGILTQNFGWRSIFMIPIVLGVIVLGSIPWKLKGEWAEARGEKVDFAGSIVYMLSLIAIMYGVSQLPGTSGIWSIAIGVLGMVAFVMWELKASSPVLNVRLFKHNRLFVISNLTALINYSATFSVAFLMSYYLQHIKGLSPQSAGLVMLTMPVIQALFSWLAGHLSDRIEPRIISSAGLGLAMTGLTILSFLSPNTPYWLIFVSLGILGLGFALFSSPNANAIMSSVERKSYGVASAMVSTMRSVGMTFSMSITMLLFALYIGRVEITPEAYPMFLKSANTAFAIAAGLSFLGIFASVFRGKVRP